MIESDQNSRRMVTAAHIWAQDTYGLTENRHWLGRRISIPEIMKSLLGIGIKYILTWKRQPTLKHTDNIFQEAERSSSRCNHDSIRRPSIRARLACHLVKTHIQKEIREAKSTCQESISLFRMLTSSPGSTVWNIELRRPPELPLVPQNGKSDSNIRVCIIGAGISGLYLGMLLDELDLKNVSYDILESNERTGGRVYTYKFGPGKMEYYDVGAMRFPRVGVPWKTR